MAPKRSMAVLSGQALKKRMILDTRVVSKALNGAELPVATKLTLCQVAPFCLAIYADERHAIQEQAVDMIGSSLKNVEAIKLRRADETRAELEGMSKDKVSVAFVQKARELATIKGSTAFKEAELMDAEMVLKNDAAALQVKRTLQDAGDVAYVHEADEHAKVQALIEIIQGTRAVSGKERSKFEKDLKVFGVDASLAGVVSKVLPTAQEDRSDFEKATVSQLHDVLMAKALERAKAVAELEPCHSELASAVKVVEAKHDKSMELHNMAKNALKQANSALKTAELELKALEDDVKSFAKNVAAKQKSLAALDKDLEEFRQGPFALYDALRSRTAPLPPITAPESEDIIAPASVDAESLPVPAGQPLEMGASVGQDPAAA